MRENVGPLAVADSIVVDPSDGGGPEEIVTVSASFTYRFFLPGLEDVLPSVDFTVRTAMKNEPFIRRPGFRDTCGQAVAEFAMVLPLMLFLFLGMVEIGNALAISNTLSRRSPGREPTSPPGARASTRSLNIVTYNGQDIHLGQRGGRSFPESASAAMG